MRKIEKVRQAFVFIEVQRPNSDVCDLLGVFEMVCPLYSVEKGQARGGKIWSRFMVVARLWVLIRGYLSVERTWWVSLSCRGMRETPLDVRDMSRGGVDKIEGDRSSFHERYLFLICFQPGLR